MKNRLLLVGSIPYDSAQEVFDKFGRPLGRYLGAVPDGEVGFRKHWISRVHYQVLALHPDIEVTRRPQLEDGVERINPRNASDSWLFKVKEGVTRIRFGETGWRLGYARDAVNSYFVFRTLRERRLLPKHLRFQVSMPSVNSAVPPRIFPTVADLEIVREGYEAALAAELATIVEKIPARDLALQWDCATEVQDAYGKAAPLPAEGGVERNLGQFERLSPLIPEEALIGFHFCFGTLGGWPRFAPDDLGRTVDLVNAIAATSRRRTDWLHIPVLDRTDEAFYAPLARLDPKGARVFLGAIHNMERFEERLRIARKFFPDFGLAAFCGLGRMGPAEIPGMLENHLLAVKALNGAKRAKRRVQRADSALAPQPD